MKFIQLPEYHGLTSEEPTKVWVNREQISFLRPYQLGSGGVYTEVHMVGRPSLNFVVAMNPEELIQKLQDQA